MDSGGDPRQMVLKRSACWYSVWGFALVFFMGGGCHSSGAGGGGAYPRQASSRSDDGKQRIKWVRCIYDQKPWLNLDTAGDRDPEGIHFRVFLDTGGGPCVLRDGTFHIEMYEITRKNHVVSDRILISDWHYPVSQFAIVDSKILGRGYHLRLRWATKDVAKKEVELIVRFEGSDGNSVRSGTKRFQVPKYVS